MAAQEATSEAPLSPWRSQNLLRSPKQMPLECSGTASERKPASCIQARSSDGTHPGSPGKVVLGSGSTSRRDGSCVRPPDSLLSNGIPCLSRRCTGQRALAHASGCGSSPEVVLRLRPRLALPSPGQQNALHACQPDRLVVALRAFRPDPRTAAQVRLLRARRQEYPFVLPRPRQQCDQIGAHTAGESAFVGKTYSQGE
jgi:hypothetical protein